MRFGFDLDGVLVECNIPLWGIIVAFSIQIIIMWYLWKREEKRKEIEEENKNEEFANVL